MNAEQYKRANNNSFYVCVVILGSGLVLTLIKMFSAGVTPGRIAIIIAAGIGAAMAAIGNFKYATVKKGSLLLMLGATFFYFVLLIAEDNLIYFAFGLPILICSIIYLNVRLCKCGIAAIILSFVITCVKIFISTGSLDESLVPAAIS